MKLVIYSVVLNQHQAPVADELWEMTGHSFVFVELIRFGDMKGGTADYSQRPYLLRAWESREAGERAMQLARTAQCCIFSTVESLPFERERMKLGLLSLEMGERWLKQGWKNLASPRLLKWLFAYHLGGWSHKPLYKLCMSAFAANDHHRLGTFRDKTYKWGYFTSVEAADVEAAPDVSTSNITPLMWCARYLMLKHPELPVLLADKLRSKGYSFHIDMYGDGEYRPAIEQLIAKHGLSEFVSVHGNVPNGKVREAMAKSQIFLFTSDRNEGWGAVANESLANGCALVASDAIGSSPYLISNGVNGFMFKSASTSSCINNPDREALNDLTQKVEYLLDHSDELRQMQLRAAEIMQTLWSPRHAAESLLQLIDDLKNGRDTSIIEGPCSKA